VSNYASIVMLLLLSACAPSVPKSESPGLVAIGDDQKRCLQMRASGPWTLIGEHEVDEVLRALQRHTCVTYLLPSELAHVRVTVPVIADNSAYAIANEVGKVLLDHGIDLVEDKAFRLVRTPPRVTPAPADEVTRGIQCKATQCTLQRTTLERILADKAGIMDSMRMVPHHGENDETSVVIGRFGPDSYAARLGFENGDHVKSIAGVSIDIVDPNRDCYGEILTRLRAAKRFTVEIERGGKLLTLEYLIEPSR
jgi:hypothetical protein